MPSARRLREFSASRTAPVSLVRLGLDLPFDEAQQDTVLLQGSPARARCNKGEDRPGSCGSRRGGSSLGCRRHHGRRQQNVAQDGRVCCWRTWTASGRWRVPGAMGPQQCKTVRAPATGRRVARKQTSHAYRARPPTSLAAGFVERRGLFSIRRMIAPACPVTPSHALTRSPTGRRRGLLIRSARSVPERCEPLLTQQLGCSQQSHLPNPRPSAARPLAVSRMPYIRNRLPVPLHRTFAVHAIAPSYNARTPLITRCDTCLTQPAFTSAVA